MTTRTNPLVDMLRHGQSVWYDDLRRSLVRSGELRRMIEEDGLRGVTSNPAIFEQAIAGSPDYAYAIRALAPERLDEKTLFERLAVRDIQDAADLLLPVYEQSAARDGYVSLEVAPALAHDTGGTVAEAMRLYTAVDRPNAMIKVPATPAGVPAIRTLIARGVNVNVTLLFSTSAYERVAEAYLEGLEEHAACGGDVARVASVASFFISRIDAAVDAELAHHADNAALSLRGKVAIANAKLTYERFRRIFSRPRWSELERLGAQTQRLLWASTGTKNPEYRDVVYVEELIGPGTVNTVPPPTYAALRDHGRVRATLETGLDEARETMASLERLGVDFDAITKRLLHDGVEQFVDAFDSLIEAVRQTAAAAAVDARPASLAVPGAVETARA